MDAAQLLELEAIKRLKYRYMRCIDQKLWDEIEACFTEDATAFYDSGRHSFTGRAAIIRFLSTSMHDQKHTSHRVHQPEIDFTGPDTASGTWAMEDAVMDLPNQRTVRGAGFYDDRYVRVDGEWRILSTGYQRSYVEFFSVEERRGHRAAPTWWFAGQSEADRQT